MTEREKFLERWSRKKREAVEESAPSKSQRVEEDNKPDAVPPVNAEAEKPFDLESLPSLESITAETDIRNFLQPGVPTDLRREALRRAWSTDPGIRDFIGLAENSGDFNDPTAILGFGPIEPSEVVRLMGQFALTPPEEKKPETIAKAEIPREPETVIAPEPAPTQALQQSEDSETRAAEADAAPQNNSDARPTPSRDEA